MIKSGIAKRRKDKKLPFWEIISLIGAVLICIGCLFPWKIYYEEPDGVTPVTFLSKFLLFFVPIIIIATILKKPIVNIISSSAAVFWPFEFIISTMQQFQPIYRLEITWSYLFVAGCITVLIANIMLIRTQYKEKLFIVPRKMLLITSVTLTPLLLVGGFLLFPWYASWTPINLHSLRLLIIVLTGIWILIGFATLYLIPKKIRVTQYKREYIVDVGIIVQSCGFPFFVIGSVGIFHGGAPETIIAILSGYIIYGLCLIALGSILLTLGKMSQRI